MDGFMTERRRDGGGGRTLHFNAETRRTQSGKAANKSKSSKPRNTRNTRKNHFAERERRGRDAQHFRRRTAGQDAGRGAPPRSRCSFWPGPVHIAMQPRDGNGGSCSETLQGFISAVIFIE